METIIIRGGGDLATGIAHRLFMAGFQIVILEIKEPTAIRRRVSFCEAIYSGEIVVEGVKAVLANSLDEVKEALNNGFIPVLIDDKGLAIKDINPIAVVDSILAKRNMGTNKEMAPITIGVGPGFEAGEDVDLVVETIRGHYLGKVLHEGKATANTGIPGDIMGFKEERIVRAESSGIVKNFCNIGDTVKKGDPICEINGIIVYANLSGTLRGMIKEGLYVKEMMKIGDIDPRGITEYAYTISEKARAIGGGVLEAIMYLRKERKI